MYRTDFKLSPSTRKILEALAPIACPPEILAEGAVDATIDAMEEFLRHTPPSIGQAAMAGLRLFEGSARLHPGHRGRPFSLLEPQLQARWFESWWHSRLAPLRMFAKNIKGLLVIQYYELPHVVEALDWHPDRWIQQVAEERMARYGEEIRKKEAAVLVPSPLLEDIARRSQQGGQAHD